MSSQRKAGTVLHTGKFQWCFVHAENFKCERLANEGNVSDDAEKRAERESNKAVTGWNFST